MSFKLRDAHRQAQSLLQSGEFARAMRVHDHILAVEPADYESRLKIADLLANLGAKDHALAVYRAVMVHDVRAGHPLPAIVASRAIEALGKNADDVLGLIAEGY